MRKSLTIHLAEMRAPTLVIAGARDPFYTETLLREMAAGVPDARLILYARKGHALAGKRLWPGCPHVLEPGMKK